MLSKHKLVWSASLGTLCLISSCCVAAQAQQGETSQAPRVAVDQVAKLQMLYHEAARRYAEIDSYVVRLRRRERVGGKNKPEEVMLFKFRKEPWSVYFKFLGPVGRGREVVYVKGHYENKIHTLTAAGDIPLTAAGQHIALAPDNILVRSASRYPITEAGIGNLVERFGRLLEFERRSGSNGIATGLVKYLGTFQRPEFANRLDTVVQIVPSRYESALPHGGRRFWFFEPALHLPVLIITQDNRGQEVEYYCYEDLKTSVTFGPEDFDPEQMGRHR
jgi:hypothetical protein